MLAPAILSPEESTTCPERVAVSTCATTRALEKQMRRNEMMQARVMSKEKRNMVHIL
jgi:hypothetical protein